MHIKILENLHYTVQMSVSTFRKEWCIVAKFLCLHKKELTYEMLLDNIDSYKCTLHVGHLFSDAGLIIETLRTKFLKKIYFSIEYIAIFNIPFWAWLT